MLHAMLLTLKFQQQKKNIKNSDFKWYFFKIKNGEEKIWYGGMNCLRIFHLKERKIEVLLYIGSK